MVQLTVRITAASGHAHHLVDALHVLMRRALQTRGCTRAHVAADVDVADAFWYSEDWHDPEALEERIKGDQFSQLLALMETSVVEPSLEFRTIADSRGLEYVATVRQATGGNAPGAM